jgi:hypothetical protein
MKIVGNSIQEIVSSIELLATINSAADLTNLQELADLYFIHPQASEHLNVWFRLYERFPNDNSEGIFWGILHSIETYHPISDRLAIESVIRQPSEFPLMMVNRLLNSGIDRVGNVDLLELIRHVATTEHYSPIIRENAQHYLDDRQEKAVAK